MGSNRSHESIFYLSKIINDDGRHLREDIQVYKLTPDQKNNEFQAFRDQLVQLSENEFLQRAFAYLDIIPWVNKQIPGQK